MATRRHMRRAACDQLCRRGGLRLERIRPRVDPPSELPAAHEPRRDERGGGAAFPSAAFRSAAFRSAAPWPIARAWPHVTRRVPPGSPAPHTALAVDTHAVVVAGTHLAKGQSQGWVWSQGWVRSPSPALTRTRARLRASGEG